MIFKIHKLAEQESKARKQGILNPPLELKARPIVALHACASTDRAQLLLPFLTLIAEENKLDCQDRMHQDGINRWLIVDSTEAATRMLNPCVGRVFTGDISEFYTSLPIEEVVRNLKQAIHIAVQHRAKRVAHLYHPRDPTSSHPPLASGLRFRFPRHSGKPSCDWFEDAPAILNGITGSVAGGLNSAEHTEHLSILYTTVERLTELLEHYLRHSFIAVGKHTFLQLVGITMGSTISTIVANLYQYINERNEIDRLIARKQIGAAREIGASCRFVDDVASIYRTYFERFASMTDGKLQIKIDEDPTPPFLDIRFIWDTNCNPPRLIWKPYSKRDALDRLASLPTFDCWRSNAPKQLQLNVYPSQILRLFHASFYYADFLDASKALRTRFISLGYPSDRLDHALERFMRRKFMPTPSTCTPRPQIPPLHLVHGFMRQSNSLASHLRSPYCAQPDYPYQTMARSDSPSDPR